MVNNPINKKVPALVMALSKVKNDTATTKLALPVGHGGQPDGLAVICSG